MEFKLTYAGPLYATQRDPVPGGVPRHTENRRHIRRTFHHQLRRLWAVMPGLNLPEHDGGAFIIERSAPAPASTQALLSARYAMYGFNFVPLVTQELELMCSLDITFLRPERPGAAVWGGDIDNRVKTLLDALRLPEPGENYSAHQPSEDEQPLFVLLEDDRLITRVSIETDQMLEPAPAYDPPAARLMITVKIKPFQLTVDNMHFAGE